MPVSRDTDGERAQWLRADLTREVTPAFDVVGQEAVARTETLRAASGRRDLERPLQYNDDLAPRRAMQTGFGSSLEQLRDGNCGRRNFGDAGAAGTTVIGALGQLDAGQMRLAGIVGVHAKELHDPSSRP